MIWEDTNGFFNRIKDQRRFGIFLDMGMGKTSLTLAIIKYKMFRDPSWTKQCKKVLIITPKAVSLSTWQNEIDKFDNFHELKPLLSLIEGNEKKRNSILEQSGDNFIHIASSGIVPWLVGKKKKVTSKSGKEYTKRIPNNLTPEYDLIIVDECSQFKSPTSARFKALKKLAQNELLLLSGTPFSNVRREETKGGTVRYVKTEELYYLLVLLDYTQISLTEFKESFCYSLPWEQYKYYMTEYFYKFFTDCIRVASISEKLYLPVEKYQYKVYCDVDEKKMKTLMNEYYLKLQEEEEVTVQSKASMINKALQLSNGFVYNEEGEVQRINTLKLDCLKDLLQVVDGNVCIFYNFVEDKNLLLKELKNAVLFEGVQQEKDWNAGKIEILVLSPFAQKYGLNLQDGGNSIIWYGLVWSAESYVQSNARLYRRGQNRNVDIFYLLGTDTYDDYVYNILVEKTKVIEDFITYTAKFADSK